MGCWPIFLQPRCLICFPIWLTTRMYCTSSGRPSFSYFAYRVLIFGWYVVRCGFKNRFHKDMCSNEARLHHALQNTTITHYELHNASPPLGQKLIACIGKPSRHMSTSHWLVPRRRSTTPREYYNLTLKLTIRKYEMLCIVECSLNPELRNTVSSPIKSLTL